MTRARGAGLPADRQPRRHARGDRGAGGGALRAGSPRLAAPASPPRSEWAAPHRAVRVALLARPRRLARQRPAPLTRGTAAARSARLGRVSTPRPVDDISERYVEEYAALDPVTATYLGIAGHDDRLPDLSPDGFAAREALTAARAGRRHRCRPRRRARGGRPRRLPRAARARASRWPRRACVRSECQRHRQRAARDPDGLRPDADRGRGGVGRHRRPARGDPGDAGGLPRDAAGGGRPGQGVGRAAVRRGGHPGPQLDRPGGRRWRPARRSGGRQ